MKNSNEITAFKVIKWYDMDKDKIFFGVDGKVGLHWYHLKDSTGPYWFDTMKEARDKKNQLSIEKESFKALATLDKTSPTGRTLHITTTTLKK